MSERAPSVRDGTDCEELYVYSQEDIERILSDVYLDIREVVEDDVTATEVIDVAHGRLTDEFYYHDNE